MEILNQQARRIFIAAGIIVSILIIPMLTHIPTVWLFDYLGVRIAFGSEAASLGQITVTHVTKPSTFHFSNGKSIDVGSAPSFLSLLFFGIITLPLLLAHGYLIKRFAPEWFLKGKIVYEKQ
ncbi:MAG: hypothetical protein HQM10_19950 [Candidatus Riflebacteria bacterium]|nr:hypothetical protein [Candidatus Riflebacteria bacterium]